MKDNFQKLYELVKNYKMAGIVYTP